jgi:hypothetical protein
MIEFIDNQTIKFNLEGESDSCGCVGQPYCQPVRISDETQFQIKGDIVNSDPNFQNSYSGWDQWTALELAFAATNVSAEGECDGSILATASLGSGSGYEYSIDGGPYQSDGYFDGLCAGNHLIVAKDSDGHYASGYQYVGEAYDCSTLNGSTANDVLEIEASQILNCYANDLI